MRSKANSFWDLRTAVLYRFVLSTGSTPLTGWWTCSPRGLQSSLHRSSSTNTPIGTIGSTRGLLVTITPSEFIFNTTLLPFAKSTCTSLKFLVSSSTSSGRSACVAPLSINPWSLPGINRLNLKAFCFKAFSCCWSLRSLLKSFNNFNNFFPHLSSSFLLPLTEEALRRSTFWRHWPGSNNVVIASSSRNVRSP